MASARPPAGRNEQRTVRTGVVLPSTAALLFAATALITACADGDALDRTRNALAEQAVIIHERALTERAADPATVDAAAADRLGYAVTGGNSASVVSATGTPDGVEVVTTIGARAQAGGGLTHEQASLGACLRIRATPGSPIGHTGQRGTVTTEAVHCPDGVVPVAESAPVEATTTDLQTLQSPVPVLTSPPCLSGSDDCVGG